LLREGFGHQTEPLTVMAFRLIVTRTLMRYNVQSSAKAAE
jgi:hypothetical protein